MVGFDISWCGFYALILIYFSPLVSTAFFYKIWDQISIPINYLFFVGFFFFTLTFNTPETYFIVILGSCLFNPLSQHHSLHFFPYNLLDFVFLLNDNLVCYIFDILKLFLFVMVTWPCRKQLQLLIFIFKSLFYFFDAPFSVFNPCPSDFYYSSVLCF